MMEMVEHDGGAWALELASGDGEGESAKCSHNIDDMVVTCER
jgi:hypothetical protein